MNATLLHFIIRKFALHDAFNADEFGLFYCMPYDGTVEREALPGRKREV